MTFGRNVGVQSRLRRKLRWRTLSQLRRRSRAGIRAAGSHGAAAGATWELRRPPRAAPDAAVHASCRGRLFPIATGVQREQPAADAGDSRVPGGPVSIRRPQLTPLSPRADDAGGREVAELRSDERQLCTGWNRLWTVAYPDHCSES